MATLKELAKVEERFVEAIGFVPGVVMVYLYAWY